MRGGGKVKPAEKPFACCQLGITTFAVMKCGVVAFRRTTFVSSSRPQLFSSVCAGGVCDWGYVIVTWTGHGSLWRGW